jgi:Spy/CpxP family protein refolding chaperone
VSIIWIQKAHDHEEPQLNFAGPRQTIELMQKTINLSDQQANQFEEMRMEHFAARHTIETQIVSLKERLIKEMFNDKKDTAGISNLLFQIGVLHTNIEKLQFEHFTKLASICNKEQKEKLEKLLINIAERPNPMERKGNTPQP